MRLCDTNRLALLELAAKNIYIEGNILKMIDADDDPELKAYLDIAKTKDQERRAKRLAITKDIQKKNKALEEQEKENARVNKQLTKALEEEQEIKIQLEEKVNELEQSKAEVDQLTDELKKALQEAETAQKEAELARIAAENDLDLEQRKSQFELIGTIVRSALYVILGIGVISTGMYIAAIWFDKDTQIIGSTWSNLFGILLTNAFSIVGTIMGVKYASGDKEKNKES